MTLKLKPLPHHIIQKMAEDLEFEIYLIRILTAQAELRIRLENKK